MSRRKGHYRKKNIIECGGYEFKKLQKLGEGTYGVVFKAKNMKTKQIVALKKIRSCEEDEGISSTTIREIALLKELCQHKNIVTLYDVLFYENDLYLIFEFCDYDLKKYINKYNKSGKQLTDKRIKSILYQLLDGISYCHSQRIFHRDLKPQNILIHESSELVKIADFGLARTYSIPNRDWSHEVITLWYRPPEVLLGDDQYTICVDIWSIGCIFAEIINNSRPLFRGDSEICQLMHIFKVCGSPNKYNWPNVFKCRFYQKRFPKWDPKPMSEIVPTLDDLGRDLLTRMLQINPENRINAKQALKHPYFHDLLNK